MASSAGSLTVPKEPRSLSLSKGARYFVHNERRMWKTTINGISCLTSLKRKQRFFKYMFTIHTLFLRLRFRLVKICNKKLCSPRALVTFAHLQSFPWACRRGLSQTVYLYRRLRIRLWMMCFVSVSKIFFLFFSVSLLLSFPWNSVFVRGYVSAFLPNRRWRIRLWMQCSSFRVIPC